ncbi:hypothetical protein ACHAXT_000721 [Thalassiosira profunda]
MEPMEPAGGGRDTSWEEGSVGYSSLHSASSCCSATHSISGASSGNVRKRYLHRLGICAIDIRGGPRPPSAPPINGAAGQGSGGENCNDVDEFAPSSCPENIGWMRRSFNSFSSVSHGDASACTVPEPRAGRQQEKIVLLRRSIQYTTKLKSDPSDDSDQLQDISKPSPSRENTCEDGLQLPSSCDKFELSSAWTSFLSKDTASISSTASTPLDGAYDLFSLPSISSFAASRCDSARSVPLDTLPSRDELSSSPARRRKVSFDSTVKAATIPPRQSYSGRMRTRLWTSSEDLYANAVRNEREYAFDGNDWRTAREENEFVRRGSSVSSSSSPEDLVHPVHFTGWPSSPHSSQRKLRPPVLNQAISDQADDSGGDYSEGMFEME